MHAYTIMPKDDRFGISFLPLESAKVKNGRAIEFLTELQNILQIKETRLVLGQRKQIQKACRTLHDKCQRHPLFYLLQARFNPFSDAYKIEKLIAKIKLLSDHKEAVRQKGFPRDQEYNDPFSYFPVHLNPSRESENTLELHLQNYGGVTRTEERLGSVKFRLKMRRTLRGNFAKVIHTNGLRQKHAEQIMDALIARKKAMK